MDSRIEEMLKILEDRCRANQGKSHWLCKRCEYFDICRYGENKREVVNEQC